MGTNNRERRKAKQKARARRGSGNATLGNATLGNATLGNATLGNGTFGHGAHGDHRLIDHGRSHVAAPELDPADVVAFVLDEACVAIQNGDVGAFATHLVILQQRSDDPRWSATVRQVLVATLNKAFPHLWAGGWQPADLVRVVERKFGARHARMVGDLMAAQRREYATATVAESWDAQLAALGATVWWPADEGYLTSFAGRELIMWDVVYQCAVEVLYTFRLLPRLEILVPIPGTARRGSLAPNQVGDVTPNKRMLDKVRALLAKAESTEFTEEAESLTAKAQELMARHSIDYALLAASTGNIKAPIGVRVGIDNPYEDAKATLLQRVAEANDCRAAFSKIFGFSTVAGFAGDVEAVEVLFTSLLVQATAAMMRAGSRIDRGGRSRTRSFRQAFLHAYAVRIGERLREATDEVGRTASAEIGGALVPVLAAKHQAVRDAAESLIGGTVQRPFTVSNHEGWISGTAAADLANVNARRGVAAR